MSAESPSQSIARTPSSAVARYPGPRGLPILGNLFGLARDPLRYPIDCFERFGDTVFMRIPGFRFVATRDPALVEQVLVRQSDSFIKYKLVRQLSDAVGQGLMVSEGEHWRRSRRVVSPALRPTTVRCYRQAVVERTQQMLSGWVGSQRRDLMKDARLLGLEIASQTLMGQRWNGNSRVVADFIAQYMKACRGVLGSGIRIPSWLPTPLNIRWRRSLAKLDKALADLIVERRARPLDDDLLSALIKEFGEGGESLSNIELRDEAITMLLSGSETISLSIAYTLWLLAGRSEWVDEVRRECSGAGRRECSPEEPSFLDCVIKEALRLYPPSWHVGRTATRDVVVGDHTIRRGMTVFVSQWAMHRHPDYFEHPAEFRPDRWRSGLEQALPKCMYLPFGMGPRVCVGKWMALMVTKQVVAEVVSRFNLSNVGMPPRPVPSVTLRPRSPLLVDLEPIDSCRTALSTD